MGAKYEFLVPDYLPYFRCKMGDCRSACCEGWPVTLSMNEYFKLLGVPCSPALRKRLDCSLHLTEHPTREEYGLMLPRYDGCCPMRMTDGRCELHATLGEDALPSVCRLYPRGVRIDGERHECACANSCEAVVEMLLNRKTSIAFVICGMDLDTPEASPRIHFFETAGRELEIRIWLMDILRKRKYSLPWRMLALADALHDMDEALTAHDWRRVDELLSGAVPTSEPEMPENDEASVEFALSVIREMLERLDAISDSIRDWGERALNALSPVKSAMRYEAASQRMEHLLPQWQDWFGNLLVNHMFFAQFPFQDRPISLRDEMLALCAVYGLLRFLMLGAMDGTENISRLVDIAASAFRLIEHTAFDRYAVPIFKETGCDDRENIGRLLKL